MNIINLLDEGLIIKKWEGGIKRRAMKAATIDFIIEENRVLMQQIKENRERFWKKMSAVLQKRK